MALFIQRGESIGSGNSAENLRSLGGAAADALGAAPGGSTPRPGGLGEVDGALRDHRDGRGWTVPANGPNSQGISSDVTVFTYTDGWPTPMQEALLTIPDTAVPQEVKRLQRKSSPGLVQGNLLSRVRSREEALVSSAPGGGSGATDPAALRDHDSKALRLALHVYACYFLAAPTLVSHEPQHAADHVLRALGMLQVRLPPSPDPPRAVWCWVVGFALGLSLRC